MSAAAGLADRFDALGRFARVSWPHLSSEPEPAQALTRAAGLSERAAARLRLTGEHTVVALAGATGSGKSSLFNSLARMELSPTGHLRPTTGRAHACVWGEQDADPVLDWLGVEYRFRRESLLDARDEVPLHGLVLLDLPDMDSIATAHRVETDRLVGVVDLVVWVLDPQKYADQTVHEEYLSRLGALRDVTVVVFNQADRLTPADAARCRADLLRLVEADGLPGVPVLATSALTGEGVGDLRVLLEKTVAGRQAAVARLEGELDAALAEAAPLVGAAGEDPLDRGAVRELAAELASAAGVEGLAADAATAHAAAARVPGWPFGRARRRLGGPTAGADPAGVQAALRRLAARASGGLGLGWPERVSAVVAEEVPGVRAHLDEVVAAAPVRRRRALGWAFARVLWWLGIVTLLAGAGCGVAASAQAPTVGGVALPWLVAGAGAVLAVVVLAVARPVAATRSRRAATATRRRLGEAVLGVAREAVAPVRAVLRDHADAQEALARAGHHPG